MDSAEETQKHIDRVNTLLAVFIVCLKDRGEQHDASKLQSPEKEVFDEITASLKTTTYGSDAYRDTFKKENVKEGIAHHYRMNRHHPEFFGKDGIEGMNLLDLVEMLADWKAASERHADGSMAKSFDINRARFKINDQLLAVLRNTAVDMGWL
jgi:hypothetical protein